MKLYPFQEAAVAFHLNQKYSLNLSDMGTGKSAMALATAKALGATPAIFGPTFLRKVWEHETGRLGMPCHYFPYSTTHKLKPEDLAGFRFFIADEVHMLKTPTAKRTDAFHTLLETCKPEFFIGLSGTPIKNRVPDFWTLLMFVGLNPNGPNGRPLTGGLARYHGFASHFCVVQTLRIHGREVRKYVGLRQDRVDEFKSYLAGKAIKFRASEVLTQLPDIVRKAIPVDIGESVNSEMLEDFDAYTSGAKVSSKAKALSAKLKAKATAEYCNALLEEGVESILVFTDHVDAAHEIAKDISGAKFITGDVDGEARGRYVDEFQAGRLPVLVATIGTMSVGYTLTRASNVVFNDLSWTPADNEQALKRIHRIGQNKLCVAHYIEATATDAYIRKTLEQKLEAINQAVG